MKKILIALSLILSVTMVSAQPRNAEDAKKAVDKAVAASQDAKKSQKADTWIKLAKAYVEAYDQPSRNVLTGTPRTEVKLLIKDQQILSSEDRKGAEETYSVDVYQNKDLYYNANGLLEFFIITKPAVEGDLLFLAEQALGKAFELDAKGSKRKDIEALYTDILGKYSNEGISNYLAGNFEKSAERFEKASNCSETAPTIKKFDGTNAYYTALVSQMAGKFDTAVEFYKKCSANGFYQEGGVFSNLAEIYRQQQDTTSWKAALEEGFQKYPESQGVLVGLINLYRESGDDPQKIFELLHTAQANEPENASLFYVEGDVYKQLGDVENAARLYDKSFEINPEYVFGVLSKGVLYYEQAVKIQEEANAELDDTKYMELIKKMDETLLAAIAPFEKAYSITTDEEIKRGVAEYLKNIFFRFRDKGEEYQQQYEKYNKLASEGVQPAE